MEDNSTIHVITIAPVLDSNTEVIAEVTCSASAFTSTNAQGWLGNYDGTTFWGLSLSHLLLSEMVNTSERSSFQNPILRVCFLL